MWTWWRLPNLGVQLLGSPSADAGHPSDPFSLGVDNLGRLPDGFNEKVAKTFPLASVRSFVHTRVGDGPRKLSTTESLLGANGQPTFLA